MAATPFFTEDAPVDALARAYGFEVAGDMRSARVFIRSKDHEVTIAPGMSRALIDGVACPLVSAPRYAHGVLVVSADLAAVIRRLGTTEPVGSSPERKRPKPGTRPKTAFLPAGFSAARLVLAGGSDKSATPPAATGPLIVVDPGHGGHDEGARGPQDIKEKDVTLAIALRMERHLKKMGCRVLLTRRADRFVGLKARAEIANRAGAAAIISIHANSYHDASVHGTETWVADRCSGTYALRRQSRKIARAVQSALVRSLRSRDRGVREGRYAVLRSAKVPAILMEIGFLSHPTTERVLASSRWQDRLGQELAKAVAGVVNPREKAVSTVATRSR
jgi:N-acetylmuramoyl-L-alanine amidase